MIGNNLDIVVGDAAGADQAMQSYLAEQAYPNVTVFCAGERCRHNMGNWQVRSIDPGDAPTKRYFYVQKDRAMAAVAEFGFVLWDGKSAGSIGNVFELLNHEKKAVLYHAAERRFHTVSAREDAMALLRHCSPEASALIGSKLGIRMQAELTLSSP